MRLIYTSLIEPRIRYVIVIWGSAYFTTFVRVFRLQKRTIRVNKRTQCKYFFKSFQILTLQSLYMKWLGFINLNHLLLQLVLFTYTQYNTMEPTYMTRTSVTEHRLKLAAALLQNTLPKCVYKSPKHIRNKQNYNKLKALFKVFFYKHHVTLSTNFSRCIQLLILITTCCIAIFYVLYRRLAIALRLLLSNVYSQSTIINK